MSTKKSGHKRTSGVTKLPFTQESTTPPYIMVVTRNGTRSTKMSTPERKANTQPRTPQTDTTIPMSAIYGEMEARMQHHFMGGIDLDETGASMRTREKSNWEQVWTELSRIVGYTCDDGSYELSFNKSTRRGECGLNEEGTHILFPLFLLGSLDESGMRDVDVIEVIQFPKPTIMDKRFFQQMSYFVGRTCKDERVGTIANPKWLADWDWYSFQRNIIEPNRNHIQMIMELSDTLTDRVVDSADYVINDWTGDADPDSDDEYTLSHMNFFTVEGLHF